MRGGNLSRMAPEFLVFFTEAKVVFLYHLHKVVVDEVNGRGGRTRARRLRGAEFAERCAPFQQYLITILAREDNVRYKPFSIIHKYCMSLMHVYVVRDQWALQANKAAI